MPQSDPPDLVHSDLSNPALGCSEWGHCESDPSELGLSAAGKPDPALRDRGRPDLIPQAWRSETLATLKLGWPLIIAQLSTMVLSTTDVIMMGWLGPSFLAAGALAHAILHPILLFATGVVMATGPMIAQARGKRDVRSVRRTVRQGIWLVAGLSILLSPLLMHGDLLLRLLGQASETADLGRTYLVMAAWQLFPALMIIVLRSLSAAHDEATIMLWVMAVGAVVNGLLNYALMFGHFGFPRLELFGAGIATTLVQFVMMALLLRFVLTHRRMKRYAILGRIWRPDWPRFWALCRLGLPIGLLFLSETFLFSAAAMLIGWLGTAELAAHAVALQLAALSFMVPLGLSQATTIRVGLAFGRGDAPSTMRAGWSSMLLTLMFMGCIAVLFVAWPAPLVHAFLSPADPGNQAAIQLAMSYLAVAGLFQLVDGAQVSAAASLRGLSDTTMPAVFAFACYWCIGIPVAYALGLGLEWRGVGVWLGLATGLTCAALLLVLRFHSFRNFGKGGGA